MHKTETEKVTLVGGSFFDDSAMMVEGDDTYIFQDMEKWNTCTQ